MDDRASCGFRHHGGVAAHLGRGSSAWRPIMLCAACDCLRDVVEVVGDAAGELAEGAELFGLRKPGLRRLSFVDLLADALLKRAR